MGRVLYYRCGWGERGGYYCTFLDSPILPLGLNAVDEYGRDGSCDTQVVLFVFWSLFFSISIFFVGE
jgi:hypothetical protein